MRNRYYAYSQSRREKQPGNQPDIDLPYFKAAFAELKKHPEKVSILEANLVAYSQQKHLPKSAFAAIKRFQYLLAVTREPDEIERWVMEDSYEGRKFRQMPLLLKGIVPQNN